MSEETKRKDRPGDQAMPVPNDGPSMHDLVCEDLASYEAGTPGVSGLLRALAERKELGLKRYGTVLQAHNGRDALRDASDESVDLLVYLRQAIAETGDGSDPRRLRRLRLAYGSALQAAADLHRVRDGE
jgi:hypothetical protein